MTTLLLVGCSGSKPYRAELPHNLRINTQAESVKATLDIYGINSQCTSSYQGRIELERKTVDVGIPTGRPSYISIGFASSSLLRGSSSFTSQGTLLVPRKGHHYVIDARYADDIYNVVFYEIEQSTGKRRELAPRGLSKCDRQ